MVFIQRIKLEDVLKTLDLKHESPINGKQFIDYYSHRDYYFSGSRVRAEFVFWVRRGNRRWLMGKKRR